MIVDSTLFQKRDLELDGLLPDDDLTSIRRQLDVALIAHGTTSYDGGNASRRVCREALRESKGSRAISKPVGNFPGSKGRTNSAPNW